MTRRMALLALLLCGCSGTHGPLYNEVRSYEGITIQAASARVEVIETRGEVEQPDFSVPPSTFPGMGEEASMPVRSHFGVLLVEKVTPLLAGAGPVLEFQVNVEEATAGWKAGFASESAFARVRMRVVVLEVGNDEVLAEGVGESWGEDQGFDTNGWAPGDLFQSVWVDAFEDFLTDREVIEALNDAVGGG